MLKSSPLATYDGINMASDISRAIVYIVIMSLGYVFEGVNIATGWWVYSPKALVCDYV